MSARSSYAVLAVLFATVLGSGLASAAKAKDRLSTECVPESAVKELEKCPGGPSKFNITKARSAAFKSKPPPREAKAQKDVKPTNPTEEMAAGQRDQRKTTLKARARALLITEIQGLERLYKRTPKKSPDRQQLIRRLAEGYVELESAAERDKIAAEVKAQDMGKAKNAGAVGKSKKEAAQAKKIVEAARKSAIQYYTLMKNAYPNYSKLDEVLYYLAYEYERGGDLKKAREVYFELIQKAPKSSYIPNAYLAFGELFFIDAQGDPSNWELARDAYREVTKYPAPANKVFGYARYKLAYVHWNIGEYKEALNEFKQVIKYGDQHASLPNAKQLQKSARRDLIPVYAASGRPDAAFAFFKGLAGDPQGSDSKTLDMLRELGLAYLDTGHYADGILLYQDLLSRDKSDWSCFYQSQITSATQAVKASDKPAIRKEMDRMVTVRNDFLKEGHTDKKKLECSNRTAELLAETAMSWHLEAVGSGGVRGTGDKNTMDLAAYLYKKVAENFTAPDFAKFEFPRIVKSDWPNMYKIKYAMADLLYFQQRWEDCGPAFDAVVAEDPKAPEAAEAAYASVLCYQKMYDQLFKGDADRKGKGLGPKGASKEDQAGKKGEWEKLKPKEFTPLQQGMIQAFNRYVCYITPPKGDKEAEEQYVEVKFARARTYFESQHWEEAAIAFRDVAINHADKDAAIYAAQLYLEAVNVLGARTEPPRPTCFDDMGDDVPVFIELYCTGAKAEDNKEQCDLLTRIQCDIRRLRAQKTVELADSQVEKDNSKALENYKKGGDAYLELWRQYGEEQLANGKESQCGRMDEIVYNMARAYQAGRLLAKSIQARLILLDSKFGLNKSDLAMKATYEIGGNYQAIAMYDRAAEFFEKYSADTKHRGEFSPTALSDSVVLRLGLGQEDQAIDDAGNFNRFHGARKPLETAQIAFAIAAHFAEKKDWENARKRLAGAMGLIDKQASLDVKVQAHSLLGRVYVQVKSERNADIEYGKVIKLWADPAAAVKSINDIPGEDGPAKQRRLGRALTAVGEAVFFNAEKKRAKAMAVKFPEYKGVFTAKKPGKYATSDEYQRYMDAIKTEKEAIEKHINTKVVEWMKKKKPLIEEATVEYKRIVDLQPVPPPVWVIAAGSRVGEMWGTFVKEFRAAPIPSFMKEDAELRNAYYGALDDASEPQKQIAKGAYTTCLQYSVDYQYYDEFSRSCEEWLASNYKSEFHLIDEFRGSPSRVNSVLKERAYPVRIGGDPFQIVTEKKKAERLDKPAPADEKKK